MLAEVPPIITIWFHIYDDSSLEEAKANFSIHKITTTNTQMPTLHVYTN